MVHERPERVEEHEWQRPVIRLSRSLHLLAPGPLSGPPPSSLPLYPCSSLPHPAPSLFFFPLKCPPRPALPPPLPLRPPASLAPFLCPDPSVSVAFPLPPRLAAHPEPPFSLTFKRFDDLEFVREVGPSRSPQVEVPEGHDAFWGGQRTLLAQGIVETSMSAPSPLPLLLKEAPLTQVVLSTQRQAAQGQPQVLSSTRLLLSALCAAARAERKLKIHEFWGFFCQVQTEKYNSIKKSLCLAHSFSPILIGCRLHEDALSPVVKGNTVSADVTSIYAGVRRGEAAGLRRGASRQRLVGARDVSAGWSQWTLTDCLIDVLDRLENTLSMDSAQSQTQVFNFISIIKM